MFIVLRVGNKYNKGEEKHETRKRIKGFEFDGLIPVRGSGGTLGQSAYTETAGKGSGHQIQRRDGDEIHASLGRKSF